MSEIEELEETVGLSPSQIGGEVELLTESLNLLLNEESYWYNISHEQWFHKGDINTSFFHKCANGRRRKTTILSLEKDGEVIKGEENLLNHATQYYKELFSPEPGFDIRLDLEI